MYDTSEGPGWWRASDGRWYPPELRPVPAGAAGVVPAEAPADRAPAVEGEPVAEGLFRRMLRSVVDHYVSPTETPAATAGAGRVVAGEAAGVDDGADLRPVGAATVDPTADPFEPIPEHPAPSPLSLRQRTPRRAGSPDESGLAPVAAGPSTRAVGAPRSQLAVRHAVAPVPAPPASITLRRHRLLPWGTVGVGLVMVLAAALVVALGGSWYQGRTAAHRSPVDAAEAFVKALYGNSPATAQSMILPGQHLDISTHPQTPVVFGPASVTTMAADRTVDVMACTTGAKRCGPGSPGSAALTGPTPAHEIVVCQG
jgi:hypothetical protein